jgi:hypothetical protein
MWLESLQGAPGSSALARFVGLSLSASSRVSAIQTIGYQQAWLGL